MHNIVTWFNISYYATYQCVDVILFHSTTILDYVMLYHIALQYIILYHIVSHVFCITPDGFYTIFCYVHVMLYQMLLHYIVLLYVVVFVLEFLFILIILRYSMFLLFSSHAIVCSMTVHCMYVCILEYNFIHVGFLSMYIVCLLRV